MRRYVAIHWDPHRDQDSSLARDAARFLEKRCCDYETVYLEHGLAVLCQKVRPDTFRIYSARAGGERRGIVLGQLFEKECHDGRFRRTPSLDEPIASLVIQTDGKHLLNCYWGSYVAIIHDAQECAVSVIRDPTGSLQCYFLTHDNVTFFFSSIEDIYLLGLRKFSINWKYVVSYVVRSQLLTRSTGLNDVYTVKPGERWRVSARSGRTEGAQYWDPVKIAMDERVGEFETAALNARKTILACTTAWARCYSRIALKLSGGLDSSIVATCFRGDDAQRVTCVNFYDESLEGDERAYARCVASALGLRLTEIVWDPSDLNLEDILCVHRSPTPRPYALAFLRHSIEGPIWRRMAAEALFDGGGGDQLFWNSCRLDAATDYLRRYGMNTKAVRVVRDVAILEGRSVWEVFAHALRARSHSPSSKVLLEQSYRSPFLTAEAIEAAISGGYLWNWGDDAHQLPKGKFAYMSNVCIPVDDFDPFGSSEDPDARHPLLAQPVVELFLRIPTYLLIKDGIDRAVGRNAFANVLPREVAYRYTKGGINTPMSKVFRKNERLMRELLLDGWLVKNRVLAADRLDELFRSDYGAHTPGVAHVIGYYLSAEVWLKKWCNGNGDSHQTVKVRISA